MSQWAAIKDYKKDCKECENGWNDCKSVERRSEKWKAKSVEAKSIEGLKQEA